MAQNHCPRCGERIDGTSGWERAILLYGETGNLFIVDGEAPIHKCPSLTPDDAQALLLLAGFVLDNPADPLI